MATRTPPAAKAFGKPQPNQTITCSTRKRTIPFLHFAPPTVKLYQEALPMLSWQRYAVAVCFVTASCGRMFAAAPANGCSASNFGQDEAALYNAASEAATTKPGVDIVVLCDSETYVFDAAGKSVHTQYTAYKVVTQSGADGWDNVSIEWQPWREERPTMRARVITPDGVVHVLDPKTISDAT